MELPRRYFLQLAAGAAAVPVTRCISWAQDYPSRPARIIVGSAAGDLTDIVGRLIGQWLSERLNQSFIIENRPGAGSNLSTECDTLHVKLVAWVGSDDASDVRAVTNTVYSGN